MASAMMTQIRLGDPHMCSNVIAALVQLHTVGVGRTERPTPFVGSIWSVEETRGSNQDTLAKNKIKREMCVGNIMCESIPSQAKCQKNDHLCLQQTSSTGSNWNEPPWTLLLEATSSWLATATGSAHYVGYATASRDPC